MWRTLGRWSLAWICLMASACGCTPLDRPVPATPAFTVASTVVSTTTPVEISASIVTPTSPTNPLPASVTATLPPYAAPIIVHGKIYDAARGFDHRVTNASIEWQFIAADWQEYNGRLSVPDGIFQLPLVVRPDDELIITASAPGYLPSTTQVKASQLGEFGTRLNFGLSRVDSPALTVPGSLGALELSGIVYNVTRGLQAPIEHAVIVINKNSVVEPATSIDLLSEASGVFSTTLELHATDQVDLIIGASGYLTTTLTRSGRDLANNPHLNIGLQPTPR